MYYERANATIYFIHGQCSQSYIGMLFGSRMWNGCYPYPMTIHNIIVCSSVSTSHKNGMFFIKWPYPISCEVNWRTQIKSLVIRVYEKPTYFIRLDCCYIPWGLDIIGADFARRSAHYVFFLPSCLLSIHTVSVMKKKYEKEIAENE